MNEILYFAYASNLDESTFEKNLGEKSKKRGLGILPGHGFRFNVPNEDGTARANIEPSPREMVYGTLYHINEHTRKYFLKSEQGYDFIEVQISTKSGPVSAFTFINRNTKDNIFPSREYLDIILEGGKRQGLPNEYLENIMNRGGARNIG